MERVLVTGANGFLATNAIAQLLEDGYEVVGVLRRSGSYIGLPHPHLSLVEGDFTDRNFISKAVEGCDHIVHIAKAIRKLIGRCRQVFRTSCGAHHRKQHADHHPLKWCHHR